MANIDLYHTPRNSDLEISSNSSGNSCSSDHITLKGTSFFATRALFVIVWSVLWLFIGIGTWTLVLLLICSFEYCELFPVFIPCSCIHFLSTLAFVVFSSMSPAINLQEFREGKTSFGIGNSSSNYMVYERQTAIVNEFKKQRKVQIIRQVIVSFIWIDFVIALFLMLLLLLFLALALISCIPIAVYIYMRYFCFPDWPGMSNPSGPEQERPPGIFASLLLPSVFLPCRISRIGGRRNHIYVGSTNCKRNGDFQGFRVEGVCVTVWTTYESTQ